MLGVTSSTCPVYQAEVSSAKVRGKLVALGSVCNTAAVCLSTWMNYGLYAASGPFQWRFPLAFQLVFSIFILACFPFVIESPRWLILRDRQEEGLEALRRLRGIRLDEDIMYEYKSIWKSIQEERADRVPAKDVLLFRDKTQNLKRLILSCGTQLMQQFSGVNALGKFFFVY
jgi:MFS family permease